MKVIDLINKQYCNEKMPKTIVINNLQYEYDEEYKTYKSYYGGYMSFDFTNNVLNMEVKIIEENKIIKELKTEIVDTERKLIGTSGTKYSIRVVDNILINKINELVKEIDKIKEGKDE